jgi:hypothetical protein
MIWVQRRGDWDRPDPSLYDRQRGGDGTALIRHIQRARTALIRRFMIVSAAAGRPPCKVNRTNTKFDVVKTFQADLLLPSAAWRFYCASTAVLGLL